MGNKQRTPTSYRQPIGVRWEVLIYLRLVFDHDDDTRVRLAIALASLEPLEFRLAR